MLHYVLKNQEFTVAQQIIMLISETKEKQQGCSYAVFLRIINFLTNFIKINHKHMKNYMTAWQGSAFPLE